MAETQQERRQRQAVIQTVIEELVVSAEGTTVTEAGLRLRALLAERGIEPQPDAWVEAVAQDAVAGRTYVVSEESAEDTGLELPDRDALEGTSAPTEAP